MEGEMHMTLVFFAVLGSVDPALCSELCLVPLPVSFLFGGATPVRPAGLDELSLIKFLECADVWVKFLSWLECIIPFSY